MADSERTFVEGRGAFVDDLRFPDLLHLKVVRSVYARARILRVKGGITHADLGATLTSVGEGAQDDSGIVPHPVLASDYVQYVGQPVAAVLGDDPYKAEDRSSAVDIEYEPLKPVVDPEAALTAGPIHPATRSNIIAQKRQGAKFELKRAPVVIEETLTNERVTPNPMEMRGIVARSDGSRLTVWASTQSVHAWREGLARSLGLPEKAIRVIGVDTGGAFGSKGGIYPEYVIAAYAAMKHRRPVKWVETRSEHLLATHQGRGVRASMKIYADRKGTVLGLTADVLVDGGAYPLGMGQFAPGWIGHQISGPYAIRRVRLNGTTVCTNKVPLGPYRGAGRPEAAFFIERMMDFLADELGMDPVDVRLRNASRRAFTSPTDLKLPPFRPFLDRAVRELGYRKRAREEGVGFSAFVLIPGTEPGEGARIVVKDRRLQVWVGGHVHGQGHEVFVRKLIREELGVPSELVDVEKGDTDMLKGGIGSWGSRSAMVIGAAVVKAARKIHAKVVKKHRRYSVDALLAGTYDEYVFHDQEDPVNSFGANLVTAAVDDTGIVRVRECVSYYDVGRVLNPAMVESQIVGGSLQAIGQVLTESAAYDENGQILGGSLADAGLLTAMEIPRFVVKLAHSRSDLPHGAKGVGESPTIGVPPALVRAIERASGKRLTRTPIPLEELARGPELAG